MKKILLLALVIVCMCSCNKNTEYEVNRTTCSGCGECKKACPNGVISMDIIRIDTFHEDDGSVIYDTIRKARIRPNRCVGCGKCREACIKKNGADGCSIQEKK
jgi:ferredoxin